MVKKMHISEHLGCFFRFWQPSLARRITLYFILFGLVIFGVTAFLYTLSTQKHFAESAARMVRSQVVLLEGSAEPDFIWKQIDGQAPDLQALFRTLAGLSSSFHSVSDIALFAEEGAAGWQRLYFDDARQLRSRPAADPSLNKIGRQGPPKIVRAMMGHFRSGDEEGAVTAHGMPAIFRTRDALSLFVDITGKNDTRRYFMRLTAGSEGMAGMVHRQLTASLFFLFIALLVSRVLGYYFARKISRPIEELSVLAAAVTRGELSRKSPIDSGDEIGSLARNFNTMIDGLREWQRIKRIEFEMEKGREIQQEFLPRKLPQLPDWELAACFSPAGQVAGDFYDAFVLPDGRLGLVIADVCDKGVGSALYMALFRSLIRVFAQQAAEEQELPAVAGWQLKAVAETNRYIASNHDEECMFATLFFGVVELQSGRMHYINAGHEPLYVKGGDGIKAVIRKTGPAVGMMADSHYRTGEIQLELGDILIGYTDGVTDARSPKDELFSRPRLQALLEQPYRSATDLLEQIRSSVFDFVDTAPRQDDVTLLAIQRVGAN